MVANKLDLCSTTAPVLPRSAIHQEDTIGDIESRLLTSSTPVPEQASSSSTTTSVIATTTFITESNGHVTNTGAIDTASDSQPIQNDTIETNPKSDPSPRHSLPKSNLEPRAISRIEGIKFAKQHKLLYIETSAKEGWNITEAFEWTAREVIRTITDTESERKKVKSSFDSQSRWIWTLICEKPKGIRIDTRMQKEGKLGCCWGHDYQVDLATKLQLSIAIHARILEGRCR